MMELRVAQYFVAVAESGSVSAAAQRCFVTQPAMSRQLAGLEAELGTKLFRRTPAGLKLNAAGERFYPIARDLVARAETGARLMREIGNGRVDLIVACPPTVTAFWVAPFVASTGAPVADIREFPTTQVYAQIERHAADVAIGTFRPPQGLASRLLATPALSVQFPAGAEWPAPGAAVELSSLVGHPLLVPVVGSAIRRALDDAAAAHDVELQYASEASSSTVAQALAAAGRGLAVVAEPAQFGLERSPLVADGEPLRIQDWAAWDPDHYAVPEIERLVEGLESWLMENLATVQ